MKKLKSVVVCVLLWAALALCAGAQARQDSTLSNRFSVRTNAIDWLLTVPNIQIGFDLHPGDYNRSSLLAGVKWNWDTWHKMPPYYVFNVMDVRGEYRYHFRRGSRKWIAQYVGGYADYSTYSIKFAPTGRQGFQGGVGASYGIELPLYDYGKGVVDVDLGVSAGICVAHFDDYSLASSGTAYYQNWSATVPMPFVTELRAAFSIRKNSVRRKYIKTDPDIPLVKQQEADIRADFASTNKEQFDESVKSDKKATALYAASDSTYRAAFVDWVQESVDKNLNNVNSLPIRENRKVKLRKLVESLRRATIADFDAALHEKRQQARKSEQEARRAEQQAEKEKRQAEKEQAAREERRAPSQ